MGVCPEGTGEVRVSGTRPRGTSGSSSIDIEDVIGFDALWRSMELCSHGVMWKASVQSFVLNASDRILRLSDELHTGKYVPGQSRRFVITSPKRREILAIPFRDRVVQRSFCDNAIYPCMSRGWVYDNYACQKGKGTDFARDRMRAHIERHHREHGDGYALCVDVRGYYAHMRHDVIERRFRTRCPDWAADFALATIRGQYGVSVGLHPGSQLAQIAGVDYLDPVDHAVKERMRVRGYGRYMDDIVLLGIGCTELVGHLGAVEGMLASIGLSAHPVKTRVIPLSQGFPWLGFNMRLGNDGRTEMSICKDSVRRMRRRINALLRLEESGQRPRGTARESYESWRAHASKGDSQDIVSRCDRWFRGRCT